MKMVHLRGDASDQQQRLEEAYSFQSTIMGGPRKWMTGFPNNFARLDLSASKNPLLMVSPVSLSRNPIGFAIFHRLTRKVHMRAKTPRK